jgi:replicative DNA helicase
MSDKIESVIISKLMGNDTYCRKVIPFIKPEYFEDYTEQVLFSEINKYVQTYNQLPSPSIIGIEMEKKKDITDDIYKQANQYLDNLPSQDYNLEWLLNTTEKWCKDRAVYLSLFEAVKIAEGKDKDRSRDAIPSILSEALSVCFDEHVGHDYIDDFERRYEFYHRKEEKIAFDLEFFNKITKGGLPNKTLNVALAGTGVGKSLFMCHVGAAALLQGKNVLYITMEMAEERIAERIDANLLNVPIQQLTDIPKQMYENKIIKISQKTVGKLIIKEYPTASAHAGHFKALLNELALKKGFSPDIIFIDYLNICASSRYKGTIVNSYTYVKAIAEELRGLAVEFNVPIVTATQTTRSGYGSTDVDLTDTSESFGLPATADLMFALISTEELEQINQILVKQLKNRYHDHNMNKRFIIGIDRAKMRLYDVDQSAQDDLLDSGQEEEEITKQFGKTKQTFASFKI